MGFLDVEQERFVCEYDGEGPPPAFWQQAARNALRGRKGQAVLRELRAALLALPEPRLIEGRFCSGLDVCPLGALAKQRLAAGSTIPWGRAPFTSMEELEERLGEELEEEWTTVDLGEAMGLKKTLAWTIAYENDEGNWNTETPEQRYQRMQSWVEGQLREERG